MWKKALLLLSFCSAAYAVSPLPRSVAVTDDATAVYVNPAALAARRGPNAVILANWDNNGRLTDLETAAGLADWGFGFREKDDLASYAIANAVRLTRSFWAGLALDWGDEKAALDAGLLYRPFSWISAGLAGQNVAGEDVWKDPATLRAGIAIRPIQALSVGLDRIWPNEQRGSNILTAELRLPGVSIHSSYDIRTDSLGAGVSFLIRNLALGASRADEKGSSGYAALSYRPHKPPAILDSRVAEVHIDGMLAESNPVFSFFGPVWTPTSRILAQIRTSAADPSVKGILLNIGSVDAGLGTYEEIRNAVLEARLAGKKVVAYMEEVGMGEYYLASAASQIAVPPTVEWFTPGLGFEVMLYKGLFDKLGVKTDFVVAGKYKGFVEPYRADTLSAAFRENELRVLNDWRSRIVDRVATGRDVPAGRVDSLFQRATVDSRQALREKWVDVVEYRTDLVKKIWGDRARLVPAESRAFYSDSWQTGRKIAVILINGPIVLGNSFTDFLSGSFFAGSATLTEAINKAAEDREVGAILLRIQSGGGSALASDIIWNEARKARKKKPVIASVGDMAASGAYYIACAADTIVANPGAIVGSIGVFGGKFVFQGLYQKLGLRVEPIKAGDKVDAFSSSRPFSETERALLQQEIQRIYATFKDRVSTGRKLDSAAVDSVAEGRIFTGAQGKQNGLVDVIGDFSEAARIARVKARIRSTEADFVLYPEDSRISDLMPNRPERDAKAGIQALVRALSRESVWAIDPHLLP